ncbi:hypothetical protein BDQ17DRAFT_1092607 [Cyathus striatus]|nr:hypothetical protein BDQ17DRAFT_1092607 [Cyathus striatus]
MVPTSLIAIPWLYLYLISIAGAVLVNVTLDDSTADFTGEYIMYQGLWNNGASCTACTATPDPGFMYNHSWKDGTVRSTAF